MVRREVKGYWRHPFCSLFHHQRLQCFQSWRWETKGKEHTRTKTINFIRIYLTIGRIVYDPIGGDGGTDRLSEVVHVVCEVSLAADRGHDLRCGVQVPGEHHICWDEELVDRAIESVLITMLAVLVGTSR
jgi:hypothetical protein